MRFSSEIGAFCPDYSAVDVWGNGATRFRRLTMPLDPRTPSLDAICVIIDFHTHIFPPDVRDNREEYIRRDPTFAEMYSDPKAEIATAEDLLASMDESGVDKSVALGFAWSDHELIVRHNDYFMNVSLGHNRERLMLFASINLADPRAHEEMGRVREWGFLGLGELRPDSQGWDLSGQAGELLADHAWGHDFTLLFHVTELGQRDYPGRRGLDLEAFKAFAEKYRDVKVVGAHLGGDIYREFDDVTSNVHVDTAAQPFLYKGDDAAPGMRAVPPGRLLFGSDFPLISQKRQMDEIARVFSGEELDAVLGGNAAKLLGLSS